MTFKMLLKSSTAAAVLCAAGAAYALPTEINGEKLAENQTYTYWLGDEITSFDPQINTDVSGSYVARDLFDGLVVSDPEGKAVPGLAESWEVSEDGLTYTFHLRDANWSDGTPIKASDVLYAWRRLANPELASQYAWYIELTGMTNATAVIAGEKPVEDLGAVALDDKTIQVTIDAPRPYFPDMLTHSSMFPVPQHVIEELGDQWTKPGNLVGSGAYVLTDYQPGVQIVREANPEYWNADEVLMQKVVGLIIADENVAFTRYDAGELDMTAVPSGQFPEMEAERPDETHVFPRSCSYIYTINLDEEHGNPAFQDVRVRRALSYALNRDVIVDNVLRGGQYPSYNWTHQKTAGFELPQSAIDAAEMSQADREAMAREWLAEAGYGEDNPLTFTVQYNTSEGHKKIAIAAQQMWKQTLGANVELANYEWKVHLDRMREGDFEVARYAWCGDYNEASTYLDLFTSSSGHNDGRFFNDEYDALAVAAKTSEDPNVEYTKMEEILAEEVPFVPVYQYTGNIMLKTDIRGYPFGDLMGNIYSSRMYRVEE